MKINGRGKSIAKVWNPCDDGKPERMENNRSDAGQQEFGAAIE